MSKFQVGDEVECRYRIFARDFMHRGVITSTTTPFPSAYNYTVLREGGEEYRYMGSELTLINESLENV